MSFTDPPCSGFYTLTALQTKYLNARYRALVVASVGDGTDPPTCAQLYRMYMFLMQVYPVDLPLPNNLDTVLMHLVLCQAASYRYDQILYEFRSITLNAWKSHILLGSGSVNAIVPFRLNASNGFSCVNAVRQSQNQMLVQQPRSTRPYAPRGRGRPAATQQRQQLTQPAATFNSGPTGSQLLTQQQYQMLSQQRLHAFGSSAQATGAIAAPPSQQPTQPGAATQGGAVGNQNVPQQQYQYHSLTYPTPATRLPAATSSITNPQSQAASAQNAPASGASSHLQQGPGAYVAQSQQQQAASVQQPVSSQSQAHGPQQAPKSFGQQKLDEARRIQQDVIRTNAERARRDAAAGWKV
jgi:hypothetical protein